jgi:polyhydroxybutyrate depolymerase
MKIEWNSSLSGKAVLHGLIISILLLIAVSRPVAAEETLKRREWTVDGTTREALISVPATAANTSSPLVFVFHMRGGTMQQAAKSFGFEKAWPEAIVVYMQGLDNNDLKTIKPGWQSNPGDDNDRDLKFFDTALESLKKDYRVDAKRIYAAGHSNGGRFTYLLWAERGDVFAAVAPSAASANIGDPTRPKPGSPEIRRVTKYVPPKPAMIVAGEIDQVAHIEGQRKQIDMVRKVNGCESEGEPFGEHGTLYPSKAGTPVLAYIHPGAHVWPPDATAAAVKFFTSLRK